MFKRCKLIIGILDAEACGPARVDDANEIEIQVDIECRMNNEMSLTCHFPPCIISATIGLFAVQGA